MVPVTPPGDTVEQHHGSHHEAAANLARFGHSNIIFVNPEEEHWRLPHDHRDHPHYNLPHSTAYILYSKYNFTEIARRPILHQWIQNGRLFRAPRTRISSKFEFFFDLVFVGIIHQLADSAAEQPTGLGLAKFILFFCPAFSVWSDVRDLGNQFGNDDVSQRIYILWIMALLVGYSNNASAVEFVRVSEELSSTSTAALGWVVGFFVVAKLSRVLLSVLYAVLLPLSRRPLLVIAITPFCYAFLFLGAMFAHSPAIYVLMSFAISFEYILKFGGILIVKWADRRNARRVSASTPSSSKKAASLVDHVPAVDGFKLIDVEAARMSRLPAINIEHHVERMAAFVTIVLGEMVANVFFTTKLASGLNAECGRSILGLMIAFNLNWIYFDTEDCRCFMHTLRRQTWQPSYSETCRCFVHALRRHWFTGFMFPTLHLPLCLSLLLASAAMKHLVAGGTTSGDGTAVVGPSSSDALAASSGIYWFFGVGIGLSVIVIATFSLLHRSLGHGGRGGLFHFTKPIVVGTRYVVGTLMLFVPLARRQLSVTVFLAVYVAATSLLVVQEVLSRLGRVRDDNPPFLSTVQEEQEKENEEKGKEEGVIQEAVETVGDVHSVR